MIKKRRRYRTLALPEHLTSVKFDAVSTFCLLFVTTVGILYSLQLSVVPKFSKVSSSLLLFSVVAFSPLC